MRWPLQEARLLLQMNTQVLSTYAAGKCGGRRGLSVEEDGMGRCVLLCVDGQSLRNPAMIGLAGEALDCFAWLECVTSAERCRDVARTLPELEEVWVVSCDDMEPINVAAAVKRDNPYKKVYIVSCGQNGSMASRVANAGIDGLWSESQFLKRFSVVKKTQITAAQQAHASLEPPDSPASFEVQQEKPSPVSQAPTELSPRSDIKDKKASVIVVVSGTGGSGKSTLSALMALISARAGLATAAVDADFQFGDLHYLLRKPEPFRIEELIESPARLERLVAQSKEGAPALLAAPRRLETSEDVARGFPHVLAQVTSSFDVVVVNTGAFWSDVQAMAFDAADSVVFVTDSRPSSLRATTHAVELCARIGVATAGFVFVVNRHEKSSLLSAVDVSCTLRGSHAIELPYGGRDVDELLGSGYGEELLSARNPLVSSVHDLLVRILPAEKQSVIYQGLEAKQRRRKTIFGKER